MVLGALIGLVSGVGATVFVIALDLATSLLLGVIAGFEPAAPVGEGARPITEAARPWLIPIIVGLGGLVSGILVFRLAPEAEGHGTDAAIAAFHHGPRQIRGRIPLVKIAASSIMIGSGGSGGREGPTAQIGAGFGSFLARMLDLDARDARIAISCGMGAGIGAIFRAPLGGAVLAAEIPYREDVESEALVPAFVGSIVAFSVFGAIIGFSPIFGRVEAVFSDPRQLVYYALIGLVAGLFGRLYIGTFYGAVRWFGSWTLPRVLRPAIAGVAVGLIGLAVHGVLGTGYGWVQAGLDGDALEAIPLWMVLVLPVAKIVGTSMSIGSGGSGGIFGPGMVVGGLLGAGVWRLLEPVAPAMPADPSGFVIVAMMALFGSVAHAPLAVMLMVAEMTGNLSMLAPAMLAIGIATLVVGDRSIYASQARTRAESPAHRFRYALPLMAAIPAGDAARAPRATLSPDMTIAAARSLLESRGVPGAPVLDRRGAVRGSLDLATLGAADVDARIGDLPLDDVVLSADDGLDDALGLLTDRRRAWAPVTAEGRLVGVLSAGDAIRAYRRAMAANVRRVRPFGGSGTTVEAEIGPSSVLVGMTVGDAPWPRDSILAAIARGDELLIPRGDTVLRAGDRLTVVTAPDARSALEGLLASEIGEPAPAAPEVGQQSADPPRDR